MRSHNESPARGAIPRCPGAWRSGRAEQPGRPSTVTAVAVDGCHALEAVRKASQVLVDRLEQPRAFTPVRLLTRISMLVGCERRELPQRERQDPRIRDGPKEVAA